MSTLPIRLEKQISGKCCYSGCGDDAVDGSDYCAPHDAHERGRDAGKKRRRRQQLANQGLCIVEGCEKKVGKRKRKDGTIQQRRCRGCTKVHREKARAKPGVPGDAAGVPGDASADAADPKWRADPGTNWIRFRGKGRRGRLTNEEQWAELERDADEGIRQLQEFKRRGRAYLAEGAKDLPRIQRDEAQRLVAEPAGRACRIAEALEEHWLPE